MIKAIEAPLSFLDRLGVNLAWIFVFLGVLMLFVVFRALDSSSSTMIRFMIAILPLWLPYVTFFLFFDHWLYYVRTYFNIKNGRVTLEVRLPQEIYKSPEAMELVLIQIHLKAAIDNHIQTYWDGKHPPTIGFEIVSREGDVRFYISIPPRFKNQVESHLYSQYPGIQIHELPIDYTAEIPWNTEKYSYFSIHFGKKKNEALPIKTYYEFGLHTMPKEEEKVDPITSVVDAIATMGPGEHLWFQILASANIEKGFKEGSLRLKPDWRDGAQKYREEVIEGAKKRLGEDAGGNVMQSLTDGERETIKAIERGMGKNAFNVVIRGMYIAEKEKYNPAVRIPALTSAYRAYDDNMRNAIGVQWRTDFDWNWWQDPRGKRAETLKKSELASYKKRTYQPLNEDGSDAPKAFTTEELASIFHLPGKVAITPTLGRIPSKTSEAPSNLPTGQ